MKLSSFTRDKDNNSNLIRIVASLAVLITHSFALAIGSGDTEPFRGSLGMTLGSIAVDVFFRNQRHSCHGQFVDPAKRG